MGLHWIGYGRGSDLQPVPEASLAPRGNRIDYRRGAFTEWYENEPRGPEAGVPAPRPPRGGHGSSTRAGAPRPGPDRLPPPVFSEDGQSIDFLDRGRRPGAPLRRAARHDARGRSCAPGWRAFVHDGHAGRSRLFFDDREAVYPVTVDPLTSAPSGPTRATRPAPSSGGPWRPPGTSTATATRTSSSVRRSTTTARRTRDAPSCTYGSASGLAATHRRGPWRATRRRALRLSRGDGRGRQRRRLSPTSSSAPRATTTGRPTRARVRLPRLGRRPRPRTPAWTAESDQASAAVRHLGGDGGGRQRRRLRRRHRGRAPLRQRPDRRGPGLRLSRLGRGLGATPAWTAEGEPGERLLRLLGGDRGRRQRRRLRRRHRRRAALRQRPDRRGPRLRLPRLGGRGLATRRPGSRRATRPAPSSAPRWRRRATSTATATPTSSSGAWQYEQRAGRRGTGVRLPRLRRRAWRRPRSGRREQPGGLATFGSSVATAGDVNGDGYADVIVGAPFYDNGQTDEGQAVVYLGSAAGWRCPPPGARPSADQTAPPSAASVATAGDVNGDGFADVIVGAPLRQRADRRGAARSSTTARPRLSCSTPRLDARAIRPSAQARGLGGARRATSTATATRDVIVGAPSTTTASRTRGGSSSIIGSASGLVATPVDRGERSGGRRVRCLGGQRPGTSTATATPTSSSGRRSTTTARPTRAGPSSTSARPRAWRPRRRLDQLRAASAGARFGASVATAGDVNGDGYADVIVGAPATTTASRTRARLRLPRLGRRACRDRLPGRPRATRPAPSSASRWRRRGTSTATATPTSSSARRATTTASRTRGGPSSTWLRRGPRATAAPGPRRATRRTPHSASSVATAGDVNGDGYADVIVGAHSTTTARPTKGAPSSTSARPRAWRRRPAWTAESDQARRRVRDRGGDARGTSTATATPTSIVGPRPLQQRPDTIRRGAQAYVFHRLGGRAGD